MDGLLKEVRTTKKVQNNIHKFESLTLVDQNARPRSNSSTRHKAPIIELDSSSEPVPLITAVSSKTVDNTKLETNASKAPSTLQQPLQQHKRKDSTVFVQKEYLTDSDSAPNLAEDAKEILKSQPGFEDIQAVLEYIQYGIDGQHDFDIRLTSPTSSLLIRVLVAVTIPDLWNDSKKLKLRDSRKSIRSTFLSALTSVFGMEALLEQIKALSRPGDDPNRMRLQIYLEVVAELLHGTKILSELLNDAIRLYTKDVQRRLYWQSVVSLLAGSKVLSTLSMVEKASAEAIAIDDKVKWLFSGSEFSQWLARNIITTSSELTPQDATKWLYLSQLFKRALGLGYRGRSILRQA